MQRRAPLKFLPVSASDFAPRKALCMTGYNIGGAFLYVILLQSVECMLLRAAYTLFIIYLLSNREVQCGNSNRPAFSEYSPSTTFE